jgi:hypothetical protein
MPRGGGGSSGLSTVHTNSTLTGAGTTGSPLGVASWPINFYATPGPASAGNALGGANRIEYSGFALYSPLVCGHIAPWVQTADAVGSYDFGVYNAAGTLLINSGAQSPATTGFIPYAILQTSVTLSPGLYVFAWTGTATTLKLFQTSGVAAWVVNNNAGTSTGGVLNNSVTAPTLLPVGNQWNFAIY